ncbi:hypothetical protein BXT90_03815 [Corynebacterium amycolatum]|nr:hypothetical protein [Corynebacterium sp. LK27]OMQ09367.1 hypothetical protein BXT90_03815 [Corynebacterium amycolatum]
MGGTSCEVLYKPRSDKIFTYVKRTVRFRRVEKKQVFKMLAPIVGAVPIRLRVFTDKCIKETGWREKRPSTGKNSILAPNGAKSVDYLE